MYNNYMTIFYINDTNVGYVGTYKYTSADITISPNDSKANVVIDLAENDYADHVKKFPRYFQAGDAGSTFNYATYFCNIYRNGQQVFSGIITNKSVDIRTKILRLDVAWFIHALSYKIAMPDGIFNNEQKLGMLGKVFMTDKLGAVPYDIVITNLDDFIDPLSKASMDMRAEIRASGMLSAFKNTFPDTYVVVQEIKVAEELLNCVPTGNKLLFVFLKAGRLLKGEEYKKYIDIGDTDSFNFDVSVEPITYSIRPRGGVYEIAGNKVRVNLAGISNTNLLPELPAPYTYGYLKDPLFERDILNDYTEYASTLTPVTPTNDKYFVDSYPEWTTIGKNLTPLFDDVVPTTTTDPTQDEKDDAIIELANKAAEWLVNEEIQTDITTISVLNDKILDFEIGDFIKVVGHNREFIVDKYKSHGLNLERDDLAKLIADSTFDVDDTFQMLKREPNEFYIKDISITIDGSTISGKLTCNKTGVFSDTNLTTLSSHRLAKELSKNNEYFLTRNAYKVGFYTITIAAGSVDNTSTFDVADPCRNATESDNISAFKRTFHKINDADFGNLPLSKYPDVNTDIVAPVKYFHYDNFISVYNKHAYDNTMFFDCSQNPNVITGLYWNKYPEDVNNVEILVTLDETLWDNTVDLTFKVMIVFAGA